ncbi:alpha/beta-hydrolase [Dothidotthia symphoricarpi CBS 119687]|uniref:Alpha/beta-hydrolase n=1 Tax=Dothidotthia symphoricarpi CBS 119687 TaxID=1392245 RepID=A0A6A6AAW2_9PLEO|nr:alpha/beta-hydrolase [Dothidotthia symphoricarpi CBS 119687]KAF2128285.1 alpha/beta-hydrolase [Dothidotthia symphoricarpi CBS 119687]
MGILSSFQYCLTAFAVLTNASTAKATTSVTLPGYGSFFGTTINQTLTKRALPASVNAWLGIDYASQPVGESRFAPVGPPAAFSGTKNASAYGFSCIQDPATLSYPQDEACLSMNVYSPQNASLHVKLPVLIWIHGGAFVSGSARSFDGAAFAANSREPLIVVTFNYRVNSLGFLPAPAMERLGLLNLGLLDQELLLNFVQQYISVFGGDPDRVTLGGRAAGAHSVGIHLFHNYNKTAGSSPLFSQAILQSGSVTARGFPNASYPLYQDQFSQYLGLIGCANVMNSTDDEVIDCLRAAPISLIQEASTQLYDESTLTITWPFQPTRGGPLLEQAGSISGINGQFYRVPIITSNVRDEAKLYTHGDLETNQDFLDYIHNIIPALTTEDVSDLESLYPDPTGDVNGSFSPYSHSPNSTQYDRLSAALTDYMYAAAGQETAIRMSSAGIPVYKLNYVVNNSFPAWQGIPHTSDTKSTWAEGNGTGGIQYPDVGKLHHGYFSDFVALGDPNAGNRTGIPKWPMYVDDNANGRPGLQLRIEPFGNSRVEGDSIRRKQSEWWRDESRATRLEK